MRSRLTSRNRGAAFAVLTALFALLIASGTIAATADKASSTAIPAVGTYELDPPHTFIQFSTQHLVVGRVNGRFDKAKGTITVTPELAGSIVDVSIDAQSLSTQNSVRDEDVRGPDFFAAAKYPAIEYHGRGVRKSGKGWIVDGALTIRDITKTVPLWFEFNGTAPTKPGMPRRISFHATAAVKRADFGMTRDLLDEIGVVSNAPDVWIHIDAELLAKAQPQP